jgi:hypothetical protein
MSSDKKSFAIKKLITEMFDDAEASGETTSPIEAKYSNCLIVQLSYIIKMLNHKENGINDW